MADAKPDCFVGVDLGGTKIYAGVFNSSLECIGTVRLSTKSQRGPEAVIDRIARCVKDAVDECDLELNRVKAVGIGAPGAVDPEVGRVIFAPNLQWKDVPLKKSLEKLLGIPVCVENDANICTIGVYHAEMKSKPRDLVGIFIGTGIGGGLVVDGQLYSGFNHAAGEIGHMVIDVDGPKCACGNKGCFEALASRTAIFQHIHAAIKDGEKTILTEMLGAGLEDLRSGDLRKAIRRGDKLVDRIVAEAAEYIGIAVANLINILNPEVVVLGGGVIEALEDEMMPTIVKTAIEHTLAGTAKGISIVPSKLADEAGITGGAVLARRECK